MLLTIKESAALYLMDLLLSNLPGSTETSYSTTRNVEAHLTPIWEDDSKSGAKKNNEDILTLLRY